MNLLENQLKTLEKNLFYAQIDLPLEIYLKKHLFYGGIVSVIGSFLFLLIIENLIQSIIVLIITFFLSICYAFFNPISKKNKTAALIEKDLPFALMALAVELNINVPFFKALENISNEKYGVVSVELKKVLKEIKENGASIQEALFHLSERIDSNILTRTIAQLINIYEQGNKNELKGEALKKIAEEQLIKQKNISKQFSGKMVLFSLMFIAVSAILPALFQAFTLIGSMFLKIGFTPLQIILITCIGFPLVDIAILYFIKIKTPIFLRS